jgi:hypothetical protein
MLGAEIFSGASTGLLLGVLLGLSSSPVVGLVVGAVAALLASIIGLPRVAKDGDTVPSETVGAASRRFTAVRAGMFGIFCVAGLLGGIYLRTHDALSPARPSLRQRFNDLVDLGFSNAEARRAVLLSLDDGAGHGPPSEATTKAGNSDALLHDTLLFSGGSQRCDRLDADRFADVKAAIAAYSAMNEPALARVATAINLQIADEKVRRETLKSVVEAVCATR